MKATISIQLIIAVYKNTTFLKKVLDSVEQQSYRNFKVSIVEDGNSEVMKNFIESTHYSFPIFHYTQEDIGFRKNKILNKALRETTEDLCVFIDGDCILHANFLRAYAKNYNPSKVLFGKRTDLDEVTSKYILDTKTVVPPRLKMILNGSKRVEDSFEIKWFPSKQTITPYLLGCNMGIPLAILKKINGFDEDYELPGYGEDCDIEWRIRKAGYSFINLKFKAIQFHFYHERPDREDQLQISKKMYQQKMIKGEVFCKNGLLKSF